MKTSHFSIIGATLAATMTLASMTFAKPSQDEAAGIAPSRAIELLIKGNKRFMQDQSLHEHQDVARRGLVAKGQHPFAVIVGCSDSRVPSEIVFDQGLGDLFVVRTAGQVQGEASLGSIEYAVEHLGAQLVVVLGHARCSAVQAATDANSAPGHIDSLVKAIAPAVKIARKMPGSLLDNAVDVNIKMEVAQLRTLKPFLAERVEKGTLRVVGARYDLDSGAVTIVPVSNTDVMKWGYKK